LGHHVQLKVIQNNAIDLIAVRLDPATAEQPQEIDRAPQAAEQRPPV
jgi:hypothetical protein